MLTRLFAVTGLLALLVGAAVAQAPPAAGPAAPQAAPQPGTPGKGTPGEKGGGLAACRTDLATFCQSRQDGTGRRLGCLRENMAKLEPACQAAVVERVERTKKTREACKADREAHCAGIEARGGAVMQCLRTNQDKLSPGCREVLTR
jgi:hypothetical protein